MKNSLSLSLPATETKILLHCCCAPCSASIIKRMLESKIEPTIFFYNPNIYPFDEYEHRKAEIVRYIKKYKILFVDADYDQDRWRDAVRGYEEAPERGGRCALCFEMRLGKTAAYAAKNGFRIFTSSLGISRWKDLLQVNRAGERAAHLFPQLIYWDYNWRLHGGTDLMEKVSKEETFYRQRYCGCIYSLNWSIQRSLLKKAKTYPAL
jgi:hypothetical protein